MGLHNKNKKKGVQVIEHVDYLVTNEKCVTLLFFNTFLYNN